MFDVDDACYGLRNLFVGDDEQTRIADYTDLNADVQTLVDEDEYDEAYKLACRRVFATMSREQAIAAITRWHSTWEEDDCTLGELIDVYNEVMEG